VAAVGLEEKYDAVRQLIAVGKERGYLLYDEVNDSLPAEVHSSEEIDDLLTTFERNGIEFTKTRLRQKPRAPWKFPRRAATTTSSSRTMRTPTKAAATST